MTTEQIEEAHPIGDAVLKSFQEAYKGRQRGERKAARATRKKARNDEFWVGYRKFLKSDEWRAKADLVLERDGHLCQACLKRKATQVHHENYRYGANAPGFDLQSVCGTCHRALHRLDKERKSK
tara:strand:+ start:78 stop:449 length:372 start_codon:yes stop_codon:yes gene_type:complete